ncbi:unnamed protein product [Didymodactylos carnosus]|uniref:Uncharacterized protein n=1 Tax=Didymodactylos carnosus TaxID=1234261 RepID=A0A814IBF7_9BILA|nr:unnamed protein product [Didymodactylos carnosus]CAF3793063.1 unnamed protein product [Didymodactylos carnosus]
MVRQGKSLGASSNLSVTTTVNINNTTTISDSPPTTLSISSPTNIGISDNVKTIDHRRKRIISTLKEWIEKNKKKRGDNNFSLAESIDYNVNVTVDPDTAIIRCGCGVKSTLQLACGNYRVFNYYRHLKTRKCIMMKSKCSHTTEEENDDLMDQTEENLAGNLDDVGLSPDIFRKIAGFDSKQSLADLSVNMQTLKTNYDKEVDPNSQLPGIIRVFSSIPLGTTCATYAAIQLWDIYTDDKKAEITWDATGNVVQSIAHQKKTLYYETTIAHPVKRATSIPLTFLLSEVQNQNKITQWLNNFKFYYKTVFPHKQFPIPQLLVNDRAQVCQDSAAHRSDRLNQILLEMKPLRKNRQTQTQTPSLLQSDEPSTALTPRENFISSFNRLYMPTAHLWSNVLLGDLGRYQLDTSSLNRNEIHTDIFRIQRTTGTNNKKLPLRHQKTDELDYQQNLIRAALCSMTIQSGVKYYKRGAHLVCIDDLAFVMVQIIVEAPNKVKETEVLLALQGLQDAVTQMTSPNNSMPVIT